MALPSLGINADLNGSMPFSALSEWNRRVDKAPLAINSDQLMAMLSPGSGIHPDFGSGSWNNVSIGISYVVVGPNQATVPIDGNGWWPDEADAGPYPIPDNAPVEGGSDDHVIVVQQNPNAWNGLGNLYELYMAEKTATGWAGQGAVFNMQGGDLQRPMGWTSADAAGLPIFPGLVRYDEMEQAIAEQGANGVIHHALRFTLQDSLITQAIAGAASHFAGNAAGFVPFGAHFRLKASYVIDPSLPVETKILLNTLKQYGLILADIGSNWFISGTNDDRWENGELNPLKQTKASNFELVDTSRGTELFGGTVAEGTASGTVVASIAGNLNVATPQFLSYSLLDNAGGRFTLEGTTLKVANGALIDFEQATTHNVVVRVMDQAGMVVNETVSFQVGDVYEEKTVGTSGNDTITGGNGSNVFNGGDGNDILIGGNGRDRLNGEAGHDRLYGRLGKDTLTGGSGRDIFVFDRKADAKKKNLDKIVDYNVRDDSIWLENKYFTKLGKGSEAHPKTLSKAMFWSGDKAHDASDRVIYDKKKGYVWYDADGIGAAQAVLVATLKKNLKMTYADFFVI